MRLQQLLRPPAVLTRRVVPGVHRLEHAAVNCYLLEERDGRGITLVDAGLPGVWRHLEPALAAIGRTPDDVRALVLTHAHFDHIGAASRVQQRWGVPVIAHAAEHRLAAHPYSYAHEDPRLLHPLTHPAGLPVLAAMVAGGALAVPPVHDLRTLRAGEALDVPGDPVVVLSPGHTAGHCALLLPGSGVLLTGDALVTLDPYNGRRGPRIIAGAATADTGQALESLSALEDTGADVLLPGHGEPWRDGAVTAVAAAREAGRPR